jgi:hypothetical protein
MRFKNNGNLTKTLVLRAGWYGQRLH